MTRSGAQQRGAVPAHAATATQKRDRKEAGIARREEAFKQQVGEISFDPKAKIYMHDDNTAMIQVCRTGRNPTMRTLGRVHGISVSAMHDATFRGDFVLGPIGTKSRCADLYTKAYPESRAEEWNHVRQNVGVYSPAELKARLGTCGPGWENYSENLASITNVRWKKAQTGRLSPRRLPQRRLWN